MGPPGMIGSRGSPGKKVICCQIGTGCTVK